MNKKNSLPAVAGRSAQRSLSDLERAALVCLADEQQSLSPNNALIAVLCDTVRLVREYSDTMAKLNREITP